MSAAGVSWFLDRRAQETIANITNGLGPKSTMNQFLVQAAYR